jgi:hypothetical protein
MLYIGQERLPFSHYSIAIFLLKLSRLSIISYQFSNPMVAIILIGTKSVQISTVLLLCAMVECKHGY